MQKAGTAWYFNWTNDMLVAAGLDDVRAIRSRFHLERFMTEANCNIGTPTLRKLIPVSVPSIFGKSYVLKTHEGPTPSVTVMLKAGVLKATYICRDPRDVVVSVYDHGERLRKANAVSATGFDRLETYDLAIDFVAERLLIWRAWADQSRALIVRYEQLTEDPLGECRRLAQHLGLELGEGTLAQIVNRYSSERASADKAPHPLHFNKGIVGRWRGVLSLTHAQLCEVRFEPYLTAMGYQS